MAGEQRNSGKSIPKPIKANWTPYVHEIFVDLCLEQTLEGNKPGTHFTKEGWRIIEETFYTRTGLRYDKIQLKNHWDHTKEQWKIWCKLIGTSSMRWDPNTQKFGASEEDWINYIQAHPEAAQFRSKALLFSDKLDAVFEGTAISAETEPSTRRRKHNDGSTTSLLHAEQQGRNRPNRRTERIFDAVESRSAVTVQSSLGRFSYSIGECIECLDGMQEVEQGGELYLFALDIFLKKEYREIFLQLKKPSVRIAWLQRLQSVGSSLPLH